MLYIKLFSINSYYLYMSFNRVLLTFNFLTTNSIYVTI